MSSENSKTIAGIGLVLLLGVAFAWAGSYGGASFAGIPVFTIGVVIAFLIQWIAFVPAMLKRTEKFFDLVGSITYLSVTLLSLAVVPEADLRSYLLAAMVCIWAGRLGSFLFIRIHKAGSDQRFDKLKNSFVQFIGAWTLQGLWVTFTLAAALAGITSAKREPIGALALFGALIWLSGFLLEAIADYQKSAFKKDPGNRDRFIQYGLWSISRHPNYLGEIILWVGVSIVAIPVLQGWQWAMLSSPFFVALLLIRISGIPLLEKKADEKWGGQSDYESYKKNTAVLVPKLW
ncbi:MAG TPA: hypothetical protein DIV79_15280 [Opitutae bacterium]|nr:hypothetical protein [Opitutaceae bacterium]HCR31367.1 hypothetical protein [Opitutae bacterium]